MPLGFLSACATPPDTIVCTEIRPDKLGWCTYTITDKEFFVDNFDKLYPIGNLNWVEVKNQSLIVHAKSYAEIKAYILKQCKKHEDCSNNIGKWTKKTQKISDQIDLKELAR